MQLRRQAAWGIGALAVVIAAAGCSGNNPVYPVQGRVNFEGKPMVGGGSITFVPLGNQAGKTAGGIIAADGTYKMTTYREGDGSMVGEFRVVITQEVEKEPEATPDGEQAPKPVASIPQADRIPTIYADAYNSPLTAKVEAKNNEINFELKRNAQPEGKPPGGGAMLNDPLRGKIARLQP